MHLGSFVSWNPGEFSACRWRKQCFFVGFIFTCLLVLYCYDGRGGKHAQMCKIPLINPWHESVLPYVKRPEPYRCKQPAPLTRLVYSAPHHASLSTTSYAKLRHSSATHTPTPPSKGSSSSRPSAFPSPAHSASSASSNPLSSLPQPPFIRIEPSLKAAYGSDADGTLECCASPVTRANSKDDRHPDDRYSVEDCREFTHDIRVKSDFTLVNCTRGGRQVHADMHASVVPTNATLKKMADASLLRALPPSVMLLGLDSSSRMNIHRAAPKLIATLKEIGAVEMTSFNKVGDNTLPNILPLLSGVSLPDANGKTHPTTKPKGYGCLPSNDHTLDECPLMWKKLSQNGYVTLMAEDEPGLSAFNYVYRGFREQPTDHFTRPFFLAANALLKRTTRKDMTWCYANKSTLSRVLEYVRSFVDTYERRAPFFSLVFLTGLGHQYAPDIELGDEELAEFVRYLAEKNGMFFAVFSDHGMRFGELRKSPLGWLEERVPFLFIRPPLPETPDTSSQTLESIYPSLMVNAKRLTSPFDLHVTLASLLFEDDGRNSTSCAGCYDLLREVVPDSRSCADAAIPDQWCACSGQKETSVDDGRAREAATVAVEHMNWLLKDDPICSKLRLVSTESALMRAIPVDKMGRKLTLLVVTFTTSPGDALMEATLEVGDDGEFEVSSDMSRLNRYGNQSWCVDDALKKLYCYCL